MRIRLIEDGDIAEAVRLFRSLSEQYIIRDSPPEGAAMFLRENDEDRLRGFLAAGTHVFHVAEDDGAIAGFIAMRARSHLFHLFVAQRYHRQGLARRLWDVARAASGHTGDFTVNSSDYALDVYKAFGFVPTAERQCVKGLTFTPMALLVGAP